MNNDKIAIFDGLTGEYLEREMTDQEQTQRDADIEAATNAKLAREAKAEQERELKRNAFAKLGLSEEEIEALVPTPKPPFSLA